MEEEAYEEAEEKEEEDEVQVQVGRSLHLCIGQPHLQHGTVTSSQPDDMTPCNVLGLDICWPINVKLTSPFALIS